VSLLKRCIPRLPEVLKDETDPLALIFPKNDWQSIVSYYVNAHSFKKYNEIINGAVKNLTRDVPESQMLNVIEIGAGIGGG
jgi:pyochelin synthetase